MKHYILYQVIGNSGDGSNFTKYTTEAVVVDRWTELADNGDERYASGDGVQLTELKFASEASLQEFVLLNVYELTTLESFNEDQY